MRGTDVPTTCPITLSPSLRYPANLNNGVAVFPHTHAWSFHCGT